jgi:hypothetical protein
MARQHFENALYLNPSVIYASAAAALNFSFHALEVKIKKEEVAQTIV